MFKNYFFCKLCFLQISILLGYTLASWAQSPFIRNYTPIEYKASTQNWAILEDQSGLMYFGNTNGVLEYDGTVWRLIPTPSTVRSLAIGANNQIYVGLVGDFGYLKTNPSGSLQYYSLKDKIPKAHLNFNEVWNTKIFEGKVFFQSSEKAFFYHKDDTIQVVEPQKRFHHCFVAHGHLFTREWGIGLMHYVQGKFQLLPGGELFADKRIYVILPLENDAILIATRKQGIYFYSLKDNRGSFKKLKEFEQVEKFITENQTYKGIPLPNNQFAISTIANGIIVFNNHGEILMQYNEENGLKDNTVWELYFSQRQSAIWAGMNNGIATIQSGLPFELFDSRNGLTGTIHSITNYQENTFVSTSRKLYRLDGQSVHNIAGTVGQFWGFKAAKAELLVGKSPGGVLALNDGSFTSLQQTLDMDAVVFTSLEAYPNNLLVGLGNGGGLILLEHKNGHWQFKHRVKGFPISIYGLVEDKAGYFWVFSSRDLYQITLNETLDSVSTVQHCTPVLGLESIYGIPYKLNSGEVVFGTDNGIYEYLQPENRFQPHPKFTMLKGQISPFVQDVDGNIWFEESFAGGRHEKGVLLDKGSHYEMVKTPFFKFTDKEIVMDAHKGIYPIANQGVYFGTNNGLLKYLPQKEVNYDIPFQTLIRKITLNDTLLYGGASLPSIHSKEFAYNENNFLFQFSSTFYDESEKNLYAYRLIGRDATWSTWQTDTKKEYTNLYEGKYLFEVKSKNMYQKEGATTSFSFQIHPPWYRTWLAYIGYGVGLIWLMQLLLKRNSLRLRRINEALEEKVKERTISLNEEKEKIKQQNQELTKLNHVKDSIFSIIGHDLRKPAIGFRGITRKINFLLQTNDFRTLEKLGNRLEHNAYALNKLTDNLLNWALTEKELMPYRPKVLPLSEVIGDEIAVLKMLAMNKNIEIVNQVSEGIFVYADFNALNTIIRNLLDNAIKYSFENSQILVQAATTAHGVNILITDNGIGVAAEELKNIFRLQRNKSKKGTADEKGTGLGLHLVQELVQLNKGTIRVQSELNQGTTVTVFLPSTDSVSSII